jgi:hypothetical protein
MDMKKIIKTIHLSQVALLLGLLLSGCSGTSLMADLGKQVLTVVFAFGGVAAAISLSIIGVKILVGNATGSSYATSQGIMALLGAAAGLVLMLLGPNIAASLVESLAGVPKNIVIPSP